ncbi:hypothetical protein D3C80_1138990 [compost metagenome]
MKKAPVRRGFFIGPKRALCARTQPSAACYRYMISAISYQLPPGCVEACKASRLFNALFRSRESERDAAFSCYANAEPITQTHTVPTAVTFSNQPPSKNVTFSLGIAPQYQYATPHISASACTLQARLPGATDDFPSRPPQLASRRWSNDLKAIAAYQK